jgi:GAF domain-containing protein
MLAGRDQSSARNRSITDVEELLSYLTSVTSLSGLNTLAGTCAGVLGGDHLLISVLSPDGSSVAAVASDTATGQPFLLSDYPVTDLCVQSRAVIPIYLGSQGDPAEWQLLSRLGFETALLVPMISRDRVIGLLECYRRASVPWSRRQIRSARTVAAMLGPVLDVMLA